MARPQRRFMIAILVGIVLFETGAAAPPSVLGIDPDVSSAEASFERLATAPPGPIEPELQSTASASYDTFNRVAANPFWGSSSSGFNWSTNNHSGQCTGYTASVDGANGVMTGSSGASCAIWGSLLQTHHPGVGVPAVWKGPSWSFTATFKTSVVDGSLIRFGFLENFTARFPKYVAMSMSAAGSVSMTADAPGAFGSAPFVFQANTWYAVKWAQAWGNQQRVKVWPVASPEPNEWLLVKSLAGEYTVYVDDASFGVFYNSSSGATTSSFDDFSFGPAPILPNVPPPPGTEHNPPFVNAAEAGDPVNTFTGTLSDSHLDVAIPGRGPSIHFARSYNSNDARVTTLGPGWTHSYNIRLNSPNDGTNDIILVGPQGRSDRYVESLGSFTAPLGVHRSLVRNADETYTATDKVQTEWRFDPGGRLTQIRDRNGNASNLSYDANGRLTAVSDPAGRGSLTLGYTNGLLTSVTDWAVPPRSVAYQYDSNGRLWKVTDREGRTTTFSYDGSSHRLATVTDARGNVALTTTYDAQGRVSTQKDARGLITGDATTFAYVVNPDGTRETTLTLPATSFEPSFQPTLLDRYDPSGWLTQRRTAPSSTETLTEGFTYDGTGNRTSVIDPRGNRTDFCYDITFAGAPIAGGAANLTRVIEPAPTAGANRLVSLIAYDNRNNVIRTVTPNGVPSGQTVDCSTDLSSVAGTHVADYAYDASGVNLLSTTTRFTDLELGVQTAITKYEYGDPANPGLVTRVIPPRGNTGPSPDYTYATSMTYYTTGSMAGQLQDVTDPLGNKTSYAYDPVGRVTSVVDPLGNAAGGVPAEHTTSYSYDKEDRLRFVTLPAPAVGQPGLTSETRYNEVGKPIVRIAANGQVTTFAYDERNSLLQVKESPSVWTDPTSPPSDVITTEYSYDAGGNTTRVTRAKGDGTYERATDYTYDGRGLARQETQYPAWPATTGPLISTASFDASGNPLTSVDPLGQTTSYTHDALNRLTGIDYSAAGTSDVTYGYDAQGNRTSMTDGTGATAYAYDEAERLTSVTSPGPTTVGYRYDLDGNRTKLIYPDATAVAYTFNKGSQLASLQDWAARSVSYTYWPDGLVKTATGPNGSVATHTYDNARRLVDIAHTKSGGQSIDRFFYGLDALGNVTSVANGSFAAQFARPDGLASSSGTWTGTFASINEVTPNDSTFIASPTSPTTSHFYEVTLSDVAAPFVTTGTVFRYRYAKSGNNSGKTTNLTVELRQGTTVVASQTHNNIPGAAGSGWQQGNLTLTPAQAALVTNVADLRLRFRPSSSGGGQGRRAQISWAEVQLPGPGNPATEFMYAYDRLYRLTNVSGPDGPRSYTYDPAGNRLTKAAGGTTAYTYDRADRILTAGATSLTVDANGNLVAKGADTFGFDQANRMTTATVAGAAETYAYDGDGTRFSRQIGADPAIRYVSDVARGLPVTIADGTRKYVYGLGLAYAVSGSSIEVYHTDRLGSVRALTDGSGTVIATYRSDEWGIPTASSGSSSQPFTFTGEPRDATGLTYLRARSYDADLGRFTSQDTWTGSMASSVSQNRYAYANNNPTTLTDPSGHCVVDTFADLAFLTYDGLTLAFGPEKERATNAAAFVVDAALVFVPCATGGGLVVRYGDDVAGLAGDAARAYCSFTPETLVATPSGKVPISSIEVGDLVLAWDQSSGTIVERTVTAVLPHPDDEIAKVTIDGELIVTTPDHPFYTLEQGWVEAGLLWPGAHVQSAEGSGVVASIDIELFTGTLWDLTVQGAHTFFVGPGESLVHNCPAPGRLPKPPTPGNMSLPDFGRVMNWGTGDAAARAQIENLTREGLQQSGVTREMAEAWAEFYRNEAVRVPSNPSARGRADLMGAAAELLR